MRRKGDPNDLATARRVVARAEQLALDRAEALRLEAEELLKAAATRAVDAEARVRREYETHLAGMRREMEEAARRATAAEGELERLRALSTGPDPAVAEARSEAQRILDAAHQDAAMAMEAVRASLVAQIAGLRDAVERTRQHLEELVAAIVAGTATD